VAQAFIRRDALFYVSFAQSGRLTHQHGVRVGGSVPSWAGISGSLL
jgi:hypothetical protein